MRFFLQQATSRFALFFLRAYKLFVGPLLPMSCRYTPTCSEYAADAIRLHGVAKGILLAIKRMLRCQPWGGHGCDPVPSSPRDNLK